jgi:YD repeat-containing protein
MDRETVMTFHDGSTRTRVYDEANDVVTYTDENGSVFTNTYDPNGRKTAVSISLATDVVGTTAQSFQYDGLSRMTLARDSVGSTNADVTTVYTSNGHKLRLFKGLEVECK